MNNGKLENTIHNKIEQHGLPLNYLFINTYENDLYNSKKLNEIFQKKLSLKLCDDPNSGLKQPGLFHDCAESISSRLRKIVKKKSQAFDNSTRAINMVYIFPYMDKYKMYTFSITPKEKYMLEPIDNNIDINNEQSVNDFLEKFEINMQIIYRNHIENANWTKCTEKMNLKEFVQLNKEKKILMIL